MRTRLGKAGFTVFVMAACAALTCLMVPDSVLGAAPKAAMNTPPAPPTEGPPVSMATGPDSTVDGYLRVAADSMGGWASTTFGGGGDGFNPVAENLQEAAFSSAVFFFVPGSGEREILTTNASHLGVADGAGVAFGSDTSMDVIVTVPATGTDGDGDGVIDTLDSSFLLTGNLSGLFLTIDLHQVVTAGGSGGALLTQTYSITNAGAPADVIMTSVFDGDLLWPPVPGFTDDEVGTDSMATGVTTGIEREAGNALLGVKVSSPQGSFYYASKQGYDPDGAGTDPAMDYGTDNEIWDAFGLPASWKDFVPEIGVGIDGFSGPTPPLCVAACDAATGVQVEMTLATGVLPTSVTFVHTYGSPTVCGDGSCDAGEDGCSCPQDCGAPPANETANVDCQDGIDNDCDGLTDCDDPDCANDAVCLAIPTVSEWGMIVMGMLLFTIATIVIRRRSLATAAS